MANLKAEDIDIDMFCAEIDVIIARLKKVKKEAKDAQKFAIDGKVPLKGGGYTWQMFSQQSRGISGFFNLSWKLIKERYNAHEQSMVGNEQV